MDGGFRSWIKRSKLENNSPDLDDYGKPLPPPPAGNYWSRQEDGSWELVEFSLKLPDNNMVTLESTSVLEHIVLPSDTLQGISLRYGVSVVSLRQLNNFSGAAFRSRKVLRVPVERGTRICLQNCRSPEVLVQQFRNSTGEDELEARLYLEAAEWCLQRAVQEWTGDECWERKDATPLVPAAAPPATEDPCAQGVVQEAVQDLLREVTRLEGVEVVQPLEIVTPLSADCY